MLERKIENGIIVLYNVLLIIYGTERKCGVKRRYDL
jgi:hypothetical protein